MRVTRRLQEEAGIALVVVLLVALVVGAISAGAALVGSNSSLISRFTARTSKLIAIADAGLEEGRSQINGDKTLYPDSAYATLENGVAVYDADGSLVPGVQRWMYVGPSGVTSGQYGVFGSIIVVVEDNTGNRIIRREQVAQESFAKYAYFTDIEPANIFFGSGDMITGPVHSNDFLKIYSSGATFLGDVTTARTIQGVEYGTFNQGYTENASRIPMPTTADLNKLEVQGAAGSTSFVGDLSGGPGQATVRVEFIPLDINGDGQQNGPNEGFIRVFRSPNAGYAAASVPTDFSTVGLRNSRNCGHIDANGVFQSAATISAGGGNWQAALTSPTRRCYVGGSPRLFGQFNATDPNGGQYVPWNGAVAPEVTAAVVAAGGQPGDAQYFIPINRQFNPSFKGVVFVRGKVAIHGVLRGQVTVAATQDIIVADDLTYATNPGAGICNDILGLFAGHDVVISDNTVNAPIRPYATAPAYLTYDDSKDEFLHGVILALNVFTVENWGSGPLNAEACELQPWGKGCLYLTGGVIQKTRGAVAHSNGYGNLKRYSYDQCAFTNPPPYFPTTGHFARGRYYEINPVNFDVSAYWAALAPPSN